jgi:phosphoribosylformylglycinamidine (FGAM) synthase-like enzyme
VVTGTPPWMDLEVEKQLQAVCLHAIREGWLRSAHDCSEGGLAVALAECCLSGPPQAELGASVDLEGAIRPDALLFGESQSRIVVSLRRQHVSRLHELARRHDVPFAVLGEVRKHRLTIGVLIDLSLGELRRAWETALPRRLGAA